MDLKERLLAYIQTLGVSVAEFERQAGLSNGYIKNFKGSLGTDKLENLLLAFPDLSYEWLVRGEGEMPKPNVQQTSSGASSPNVNGSHNVVAPQTSYGDYSPNVRGDNNHVGGSETIDKAFATIDRILEEMAAQRRLVEQSMAQTAALISILQNQNKHQ